MLKQTVTLSALEILRHSGYARLKTVSATNFFGQIVVETYRLLIFSKQVFLIAEMRHRTTIKTPCVSPPQFPT